MKARAWRSLMEKIEAVIVAAAIAEEGEVEAARRIMAEAGMGGTGAAPRRWPGPVGGSIPP